MCLWDRKISTLSSIGTRTTAKVFPCPRKTLDIKIKKIGKSSSKQGETDSFHAATVLTLNGAGGSQILVISELDRDT